MANVHAIHSIGVGLARLLTRTYPLAADDNFACTFEVYSSKQMNGTHDGANVVSLFLYRVTVNEHLRNAPFGGMSERNAALPLDLHWMLTVWSDSAEVEHTVLAWVMQTLHAHETLSGADLPATGGWSAGEVVQLIPAELATEDMMRIWDALDPPYRLSVSYIARVVCINPERLVSEGPPVVSRRFDVSAIERGR